MNVLITGASGMLGKALLNLNANGMNFLTPTKKEMDIRDSSQVSDYFKNNKIDAVIHCAAIAKVKQCDLDSENALFTNINGTSNVVKEAFNLKGIRFIYISTDYVYPCTEGNYSEEDLAIPFTLYGWTKLAGECVVRAIENHCIIRTSFFDKNNIPFSDAPSDAFSSKIEIRDLAKAILLLTASNFKGIINVGQEKKSLYDLYKKYKPEIKESSIKDLSNQRARDSSMNVLVWRTLSENIQKEIN